MFISPERLATIIKFVEENHIGLLRSPPSSGKSTLGEYLHEIYDEKVTTTGPKGSNHDEANFVRLVLIRSQCGTPFLLIIIQILLPGNFLNPNESISADVGPVFGSAGFLDFYVNGDCCWGIELTREGSLLKKHEERFENDGIYDKISLRR
ncbi:5510_t:CDS:2 [Funneliformis caledonium]|uniref:5510_t:CDS:1 n=1 Tax=Funneliformis caledonium TaxID=1117310 RepID=A0A9N9AYS4_9GLOM|nr:5510_t:CDS:2 [Funneliformis caledonium]